MAEYTAQQVSVVNGSNAVIIESGESPEAVRQGDFLFITGSDPVGINRTYINSNSQHVIELSKSWSNGNKSNQPAIVLPTTVEFKSAAAALKNANLLVNDNFVAMQDWQTKTGTVTFVNIDGTTTTVKTLKQIEIEAQELHPHPYAMRKVEFEALRAANNEKFAASGFVHFGKSFSPQTTYYVNEGLWCKADNTAYRDKMMMGWGVEGQLKGDSKTNFPEINIAGVNFKLLKISNNILSGDTSVIKFPPAEDGTRTYDSETGNSVTHSTPAIAFASETDTNKVVTDRVDMWGFEAFLREIHDGDPFVYKNGLIQSLSTDIDGVTTVTDNVRPDTYFAWYEGDEDSRGKGVNWQTATESQRMAIASNPENNIYFDDETGKFYQWCIRGRSFAGIGNGDWDTVDASRNANLTLRQQPVGTSQRTPPQGLLNTAPTSGDGSNYYSNTDSEYNLDPKIGLFTSRRNDVSSGGFSYFLVCGTVNRLNQGAYHPSLNPQGSKKVNNTETNSSGGLWYQSSAIILSSRLECFIPILDATTNTTDAGVVVSSGSILTPSPARSDGRLHDAIYASGQGGVCRDMRYSAWGLTPSDFAEADLKVKSGKYRGTESLVFSKPYQCTSQGKVNGWGLYHHDGLPNNKEMWITSEVFPVLDNFTVGDLVSIIYNGGSEIVTCEVRIVYSDRVILKYKGVVSFRVYSSGDQASHYFITHRPVGLSVSGSFNHTEVIAAPATILQCDDLKDGWVGSWNPKIADGVTQRYYWTRKFIEQGVALITDDNGASYTTGTQSAWFDNEQLNSTISLNIPESRIVIGSYTASAKYTENAENMPIFGGYDGIGHVIASSDAYALGRGMLLRESLIGKPAGLSSYTNGAVQSMRPNVATLDRDTLIGTTRAAYGPAHDPIVIDGSTSLSGVKALNYNVVEKQQGFIQYAYTEIIFDGDWGDDGKIYITDNQSTRLDDNGNTALYGTARIAEPLGWIKNDK